MTFKTINYILYISLAIVLALLACKTDETKMTKEEIELINSKTADSAFRVLQTTNEVNSLFLRLKAKDLDITNINKNKDLQLLIERMKATLIEKQGVGLAAPQIGISRNLFIFVRVDQPDSFPMHVAINPKIVNHPDETICFEGDGCLSIPDTSGNSIRYPWIDVQYYNEKGELIEERLFGSSRTSDFTAIIFQHEFDHLQGVLFTDKLYQEEETDNEE